MRLIYATFFYFILLFPQVCISLSFEQVFDFAKKNFPGEILDIKKIGGGYSKESLHKITFPNQAILISQYNKSKNINDFAKEVYCSELMQSLDLGPKLIKSVIKDRIMISEFIENTPTQINNTYITNIAQELKKLHGGPVPDELNMPATPIDVEDNFNNLTKRELSFNVRMLINEAKTLLDVSMSELHTLLTKSSIIHGDLHPRNVLLANQRAWLIDFESMGRGDPYVDLAVVCIFLKEKEQKKLFLETYLGDITLLDKRKIELLHLGFILSFASCILMDGFAELNDDLLNQDLATNLQEAIWPFFFDSDVKITPQIMARHGLSLLKIGIKKAHRLVEL